MTKSTSFITIGRALGAYLLAIIAGSIVFMPLLMIDHAVRGGGLQLPVTIVSSGVFFGVIRVELGAMIAALIAIAGPMSPLFVAAIAFAKWKSIRHWSYYLMVGSCISFTAWTIPKLIGHRQFFESGLMLHGSMVFIILTAGWVGGIVCWLFLKYTSVDQNSF